MFLDWKRKLEHPEEIHKGMGRAWKLHTEKALNLLGIEPKDLVAACVGLCFIKNNNASQSEQTKPDRTLLQRSADVEVHQFYEPLSPCDFAATHVLNGSCRQKIMPLCWDKWRERMGLRRPLWGASTNICLCFLSLFLLKIRMHLKDFRWCVNTWQGPYAI